MRISNFLLLISISSSLAAQQQSSVGVSAGLVHYIIEQKGFIRNSIESRPGISIGANFTQPVYKGLLATIGLSYNSTWWRLDASSSYTLSTNYPAIPILIESKLDFLEFPLMLRYPIPIRKKGLIEPKAGILPITRLKEETYTTYGNGSRIKEEYSTPALLAYQVGVSLGYQISEKLVLKFEPVYRHLPSFVDGLRLSAGGFGFLVGVRCIAPPLKTTK